MGWYVTPLLWRIRGWADKAVGGVGLRRGRRNPDMLGVGDAVDFWRVEAVEPDRRILLRAEMRLPGEAWLEWVIEPEGAGSRLTQRAIFYPRGLLGRAYWYALIPFHALIFRQLAERLASEGGLQGSVGDPRGQHDVLTGAVHRADQRAEHALLDEAGPAEHREARRVLRVRPGLHPGHRGQAEEPSRLRAAPLGWRTRGAGTPGAPSSRG